MRVIPKVVKIHAKEMAAVHLSAKANYKALLVGAEKYVAPKANQEFIPESVNSTNGWNKQWRHIKKHVNSLIKTKQNII